MKYTKQIKKLLLLSVETAAILCVVLFSILPLSCKVTAEGIHIVGGDYQVPVLEDLQVRDGKTISMNFSQEVTIKNLVVSPFIEAVSDRLEDSGNENLPPSLSAASGSYGIVKSSVEYSQDGKIVNIILEENAEVGKKYEVYGVVTDKIGNSLTFCFCFSGYNSRLPKLIMTELHTAMAGQLSSETEQNIRRLEYVEFLCLTDGNLAGLELVSGYNGESKKYEFPPVEVKAGEVFVLHMRNWGNGCISEETENLNQAFSTYSGPYRDLWTTSTAKPFGDKNDFIILRNGVTGEIYDAVMYSDNTKESWSDFLKTDFSKDQQVLTIIEDPSIENAVSADKLSATKVIYRKNALQLFERAGVGGEIDYPVMMKTSDWEVGNPTPGSL